MNFNSIPPITKNLLIANVALFLLCKFILPTNIEAYLYGWFPFTENFRVYQIITHMFMHGGWLHLIFNMFGVWMFGSAIENYFREKKYVILYFASGLGAYILHFVVVYYTSDNFNIPVVGASGALFGLLAAFAVLYPNVEMMLIFLPIPIKAKYFVLIYMLIELFGGITQIRDENTGIISDNIAHFAHIGGGIVGFLLTKYWMKNRFRIN